jgi:hypothetical protein
MSLSFAVSKKINVFISHSACFLLLFDYVTGCSRPNSYDLSGRSSVLSIRRVVNEPTLRELSLLRARNELCWALLDDCLNQPPRVRPELTARPVVAMRAAHGAILRDSHRLVLPGLALAESAESQIRKEARKFEHPDFKVANE